MNKNEIKDMILQEAKYIKSLLTEKKELEKKIEEIENDKNENISKSTSLTTKKSTPQRLKKSKEIEETTGKGQGVNRRASHKGKSGENLKLEEAQILQLRKAIRKTIYENYGVQLYTLKVKHDNGTVNLKTSASSEEEAIKTIMNVEGCPRRAILSVKLTNPSKKLQQKE